MVVHVHVAFFDSGAIIIKGGGVCGQTGAGGAAAMAPGQVASAAHPCFLSQWKEFGSAHFLELFSLLPQKVELSLLKFCPICRFPVKLN